MEKYAVIFDTNILGEPKRYDFKNGNITLILNALKDYTNIDVYFPSLVIEEVKIHIKNALYSDFFESKSKYFKDNVSTQELFDKIVKKVFNEFEKFMMLYKIKVLDCYRYMNMEEINKWYFNKEMPFEISKPKEFPDAMIISSIINFLDKSSYTDIYIISNDSGFRKGIESHSKYSVYETIGSVMKNILDYNDSDLINIKKCIEKNKILYSLDFVDFSSADSGDCIDVSVDDYCINDIEVIGIEDNRYDLNIIYDINVSGNIYILDPYSSVYDREDSKYYYSVYKETDKLTIRNVSSFFSVYKKENGTFYNCESIMSTSIDMTEYLNEMNDVYN